MRLGSKATRLPPSVWPSPDDVGTLNCSPRQRWNDVMAGRVLHVEGYEGKVVAIDMVTDHVVASEDSFPELTARRISSSSNGTPRADRAIAAATAGSLPGPSA